MSYARQMTLREAEPLNSPEDKEGGSNAGGDPWLAEERGKKI